MSSGCPSLDAVLLLTSKRTPLTVLTTLVNSAEGVRNLGVIYDRSLSLHVFPYCPSFLPFLHPIVTSLDFTWTISTPLLLSLHPIFLSCNPVCTFLPE